MALLIPRFCPAIFCGAARLQVVLPAWIFWLVALLVVGSVGWTLFSVVRWVHTHYEFTWPSRD